MKVIDLLNKIANGEEVPKKIHIKQFQCDFIFNGYTYLSDDLSDEKEQQNIYWCLHSRALNYEVEILEEKKIPEKWNDLSFTTMIKKEDSIDDDIHKLKGYIETIMRTQNEIIDYLKSKGK